MNLDGIWGGNMFAGGSGAILPNKITSKHNFRYIPNMTGPDIVAKLRKYLDKLGYSDVEINVVGDVPWAKRNTDNEIGRAVYAAFDQFGIGHAPISAINSIMGGYWPAYLFSGNGAPFDIRLSVACSAMAAMPCRERILCDRGCRQDLRLCRRREIRCRRPLQLRRTEWSGRCRPAEIAQSFLVFR